jgi:hypothetical protein
MSDNLNISPDLESNEARHPNEGMKVGLIAPKIRVTPIAPVSNDFWSNFGADKQLGNLPETASNG